MAFKTIKILSGRANVPETLILPAKSGESFSVGQALTISGGALSGASGDTDVFYISLENLDNATADAKLACCRVTPDMLFEVPVSAYSASVQKLGAHVTISSDGLEVTATAASSGFGAEIVDLNSAAAAGDKIICALK